MSRRSIRGRDANEHRADCVAILDHLADYPTRQTAEAQNLWHRLDRLSRSDFASAYTRRRARAAAVALGSLLDDLAEPDEAEQPLTWNDRDPDADHGGDPDNDPEGLQL